MNVIKLCRLVMPGIASKAKRGGTRLQTEEVVITVEESVTWQEIAIGEMVAILNLLPMVEAKMAMG